MLLRTARESVADASFIVMAGEGTQDILTEGLRLGMFALVDKPLNRLALITLVQQAIECHGLRQEVAELRRTLTELGVEWGSLMRGLVEGMEEVFQPLVPYRCPALRLSFLCQLLIRFIKAKSPYLFYLNKQFL
jgi:DNA-binding NtrC family response regulator